MHLTAHTIPTTAIELTTEWNLHPWDLRNIPENLLEDLSRTGILNPPLVKAKGTNQYTLISGYRRVQFVKTISGDEKLLCLLVGEHSSIEEILDCILSDQQSRQGLTLAEKAQFLAIATHYLKSEIIVERYLRRMQLKPSVNMLSGLLQILEQPELIIRTIHEGRLQEKMISEIIRLTDENDRTAVVQLFNFLKMGDGKQKRLFSLLRDVAFRDGLSLAEYLQKPEITEIISHQEMNSPQKNQHLIAFLQQQATPAYRKCEEEFNRQVGSLRMPDNYSLSHSPFFEKDDVTLTITFKNMAGCTAFLKRT